MMDWVSHTVLAFGQSVGIPDLVLDGDGCALFTLQPDGLLCLQDLHESGSEEMLVILAKPVPSPDAACLRRALKLADFRRNPAWQMQLSLRGPDLVATLRLPRHAFLLNTLEEAVDALFNFHARIAQVH